MKIQRFMKKCEEFVICGGYGDADTLFIDGFPDNKVLYHIIVKGNVKMARPFESNYVSFDSNSNNFVDVREYLYSQRVYLSTSPYHIYGFNPIETDQNWDGKLINKSFDGNDKSWLVCFQGEPTINGVSVKPMDYAKLENKKYEVNINDAIVGVFTKI
tara:strand:- start:611 stop:1084 length:474 start_codon:yes stop_codon:yes gene_type:complete